MPIISDLDVWNEADSEGDWNTSDFDAPKTNDSSATTPIFFPNNGNVNDATAMDWPLKKGVNDGRTNCTISSRNVNGQVVFCNLLYMAADVANIPITEFFFQYSSSSGFTSNYGRIDALSQLSQSKGGWTTVRGYATQPDASASPNYNSIIRAGFVASAGNNNDGKFGGFERMGMISYLGGHSQTVTLDQLFTESEDEYIFLVDRSGAFFSFNVRIRLGATNSGTTNFNENNRTIFFDNLATNHALGWEFLAHTGSGQNQFELTNSSVFWNGGQNSSNEMLLNAANLDRLRVEGVTFTNGGRFTFRSAISAAETYVRNSTFLGCEQIRPLGIEFTGNTLNLRRSSRAYRLPRRDVRNERRLLHRLGRGHGGRYRNHRPWHVQP